MDIGLHSRLRSDFDQSCLHIKIQLHLACLISIARWTVKKYDEGTTMMVNPFLDLKLVRDEGVINAVMVRSPVKGEALKVTTIDRKRDQEIFEFLLIHMATKGAHGANSATDRERERLMKIGVLVRQASRPVFYSCDFDDVPSNLLPLRAQRRLRPFVLVDDLIVDPTIFITWEKMELRLKCAGGTRSRVRFTRTARESRSKTGYQPRCSIPMHPDASACVDLLSAGQPVPKNLSFDARQKLEPISKLLGGVDRL